MGGNSNFLETNWKPNSSGFISHVNECLDARVVLVITWRNEKQGDMGDEGEAEGGDRTGNGNMELCLSFIVLSPLSGVISLQNAGVTLQMSRLEWKEKM